MPTNLHHFKSITAADDAKGGQKYLWQIDYKSYMHNQ